ncbi:MAG: DUF349 domain-containing protein [Candidatus Cryptobacteroides sp.]|uniref:DUF349 domain-containing protein n=1 Tax=Candidatus Cryptobacteroides sp. TaxID=2952915 RepID=UPI002A7FBB91|nr:DUF349 domain-containing protein [Candidatus Cryptobacteroides sp.]MDY3878590.1 DUF349 domain-containing protein [Candidatus Cryptobacteroides sp.]MDY5566763.1 DUF349 domain-containing protein [Candidatus Cryptobacteroides sp.]
MSEDFVPEVTAAPDVEETTKALDEETAASAAETVDLNALSLSELSEMFDRLSQSEDRMKRYKEAEAIKSAFYKKLSKEKAEAGLGAAVDEPSSREDVVDEVVVPADGNLVADNPFEAMEAAFKGVYANYKKERAEYNRQQDALREENLVLKQAVIDDLKALVEKQEDVNSTFPAFRELQNRWKSIGPVPASKFRDLNDNYQYNVEKFYDMVKINRDLRDLDFKKNLEAKQKFCEFAEKLSENDNVVEAFRELQKLHEQWKEFGPVAKEFRDSIWERFKAATSVINKKYQAYFEEQKEKQQENLEEKTKLCEMTEAIASKEVKSSNEWNTLSAEIEEIQKKWRTIGFATRKENQKIYDRFRAACDKFFERKREYYAQFKDTMNENMEKKLSLIEQAEALKDSKEWKKTTEALIALQKQWKEIGAVPRKKSEQLWKRFRAACDSFFNERDAQAKPENDYYGNLKAKKALIEEIKAYELSEDAAANLAAAKEFAAKWQGIGFVPFKEKENIQAAYNEAFKSKFPDFNARPQRGGGRTSGGQKKTLSEKDRLVQQYGKLQQDIVTYENNIGFFSASKNSEPFIRQMQERIDAAKQELKALEAKIRTIEEAEEE